MNAMLKMLADVAAPTAPWGGFWMPPQGSQAAGQVDWLFYFVYYICLFFFLLILVLLVTFAIKYRHREGAPVLDAPKHNTALELTWTFIPTLIVIVIFFYGFKGYLDMAIPPRDAYEVDVTAHMWDYTFSYPNGQISDDTNLHIPVNTPVVFVLTSTDVLHGFYMPIFRIKKDVVPGRYNKIWVQATMEGTFDIFCTQYCGQDHSSMRRKVIVESREKFESWVNNLGGGNMKPAERGKYLWNTRGCSSCHTNDGTNSGKAPSWQDLYMSQQQTMDGMHLADENYIHEVITHPNIHPIAPYQPIMPPTEGLINDKDIGDIIAYLKTISKYYHPPALPSSKPAK
jgi:cytochrome c oxidase subunit 2